MSEPLTIRNVSNVPLELKRVEHFDPAPAGGEILANVTTSFAAVTSSIGITNNITRAAVPKLSPDAHPFATRDVSIPLPPFTVTTTDVQSWIKAPTERLRLTFQTNLGGQHQMYCPVPTTESAELVALAPNPVYHFTGVFLPANPPFVALYTFNDLSNWMSHLPDHLPLSALSIPGTHNSPTCHAAPPSVRCQAVCPKEQLENGVRFFDLRVQVPEPYDQKSDKLILVHSVFPISLAGPKYFRDIYNTILNFLKSHPTETLIMSVKREGTGAGTDQQLGLILHSHYTSRDSQFWFTQPRVPSLGESRGKIILFRRFGLDDALKSENNGTGFGIAADVWADNTPFATCPSGDVCIQDFYEVLGAPTIDKKIEYCNAQLERAGDTVLTGDMSVQAQGGRKLPIYVNFLSASNFWKLDTWPEKIAARVNPSVIDFLCRRHMVGEDGKGVRDGDWSTGVVITDWVGLDGDWDLVRCVVGMNSWLARDKP